MPDTYTEPLGDTWRYDPSYHRLADFLGVDKYERDRLEFAEKLSLIADWSGLDKHGDVMKAMHGIKRLQRELGVQVVGKPLVTELYQAIRLGAKNPEKALRAEVKKEVTATMEAKYEAKIEEAKAEAAKQATARVKRELKRDAAPPPAPEPVTPPAPEPVYNAYEWNSY